MIKSKISILFVAGFYYPSQMGGPCNSFYWLAKALGQSNIDVTVIAMSTGVLDKSIIFDEWIETDYGRVIYIKTKYTNYSIKYIISCIRKVKSVQLVHLNSIFSLASFIIGIITITFGKPIVWSPRGEFSSKALVYKQFLKKLMLSMIRRYSNRILFHTTSNIESNDTIALFGNDSNLLELPNYMELPSIDVPDKSDYFLCIGRIHPIKGLENLIYACSRSQFFRNSIYKLMIVGNSNNDYGLNLKNLVFKNKLTHKIIFIPHVSDIKVKNELFQKAVFSFLPSYSENFGNVVVESLGNGTPVVASFGTPWQILEEYKAGFWVSNNPIELANIIDKIILMSQHDLQSYFKNAKELAISKFDIKANVQKWVISYQKLIITHEKD